MENKMVQAAKEMFDSTLITYFGTVSGRLALDPDNQELITEHRILGNELQNRMS